MAKTKGQKLKILFLLDILHQHTDDEHGISMAEILDELQSKGIDADRKSIYDDIRILAEDYGADVICVKNDDKGKRLQVPVYKLVSRTFDLSDLRLLIDGIQSSRYLSRPRTEELMDKLRTLCSKHEVHQLQRQLVITRRVKSMNNNVLYYVSEIQQAIREDKKLSFRYFSYTPSKAKQYKKRVVSPFSLVYTDDNYYLLAYNDTAHRILPYRVDRMEQVTVEDEPRTGTEAYKKIKTDTYTESTFGMFSGKMEWVTMQFANELANVVIDRFGKEINTLQVDEGHFQVSVDVAVSPQFFGWVVGLGTKARIVAPQNVVDSMANHLAKVGAFYPTGDAST